MMKHLEKAKRPFAALVFLMAFILPLHAEDPLSATLQSSKALVDIQSVNATVVTGQPQGLIDKTTGQFVILRHFMPITYARSGSGIIIDPRGIIVTNAHTIRDAGGLAVTLFNGTRVDVKEAHLVPGTDIAFLRIEPPIALSFIAFADSDRVKAGTSVFSIGHSQWLNGTVLGGKIVAVQQVEHEGGTQATALELDFNMEEGDSGCPVLDSRGELLGMIGAKFSGISNAALAIPSNAIKLAYQEYLAFSKKANG
jgi:S1-C subfamily serine protease